MSRSRSWGAPRGRFGCCSSAENTAPIICAAHREKIPISGGAPTHEERPSWGTGGARKWIRSLAAWSPCRALTPTTTPRHGTRANSTMRWRCAPRAGRGGALKALTCGFCAPGRIRTCDTRFRKTRHTVDCGRHQHLLVARRLALSSLASMLRCGSSPNPYPTASRFKGVLAGRDRPRTGERRASRAGPQ